MTFNLQTLGLGETFCHGIIRFFQITKILFTKLIYQVASYSTLCKTHNLFVLT